MIIYDKAKYHSEEVASLGLPEEHTFNHTTFYLSWIIQNNLLNKEFLTYASSLDNYMQYNEEKITINQLYNDLFDACLASDVLSEEGNAFTSAYFDFHKGKYLEDYHNYLQKDLPSEFHVLYTPENEAIIHSIISKRFQEWKNA